MHKLILLFVSAAALGACTIRVNEDDEDWQDWEEERGPRTQEERAADACDPYCIELISCDVLSDRAFENCRSLCVDRFSDDEARVTSGTACVRAAECQAEAAEECSGHPLPGIFGEGTIPEDNSGAAGSQNGGDD